MTKRFSGKTCAYCAIPNSSATGDHVVARQFFLARDRANLPKVPACTRCNNAKSSLEHYLTAVLPFGGRHATATENLETQVPRRLENNQRLAAHLRETRTQHVTAPVPGTYHGAMALQFDWQKYTAYLEYLVRGLCFFHWNFLIDDAVEVKNLNGATSAQDAFLKPVVKAQAWIGVKQNLGDGTFEYIGLRSRAIPSFTLWEFAVFGGAVFAGDERWPSKEIKSSRIVTLPKNLAMSEKAAAASESLA